MEEKKSQTKILIVIAGLSLLLSVISLLINCFLIHKLSATDILRGPVVISKQYDKGQSLEKALKKDKPVIIWFYTDWCGFCQRLAPTFGKITKDWKIKNAFAVAYINADLPENQDLLKEYEVKGYPSVFLLNPKTKEKTQVDNEKLFAPDAKKELKKELLAYAKLISSDNKKDEEEK